MCDDCHCVCACACVCEFACVCVVFASGHTSQVSRVYATVTCGSRGTVVYFGVYCDLSHAADQFKRAKSAFEKVLVLHPGHPDALSNLEELKQLRQLVSLVRLCVCLCECM